MKIQKFALETSCKSLTLSLDTITKYKEATCDISQLNIEGIQAKDVKGYKLQDTNFIFSWDDVDYKKMVLTSNTGVQIKAGYLHQPATSWKDPNTWEPAAPTIMYTISNCKLVEESRSPSKTFSM